MNKLCFSTLVLVAACSSGSTPKDTTPTPPATLPATAPAVSEAQAPVAPPMPPVPSAAEAYTLECRGHLDAARGLRDKILAEKAHSADNTLEAYNLLQIEVSNALEKSELYSEVHPDAAVRAASDTCQQEGEALKDEIKLDPGLYQALASLKRASLDAEQKDYFDFVIKDLKRAGVDKDEPTRAKLKEARARMVTLALEFDKNVRDDVRTVKLDPAQLDGLPEDFKRSHKPGADGKVAVTTDYTDYYPFRQYARSAAARKALTLQFLDRAYPQNQPVFTKLLEARQEFAKLLGYKSFADYSIGDKMMHDGDAAQKFIDKVAGLTGKRAKADYAALLALKLKDDPQATQLEPWDFAFYEHALLKEKVGYDAQDVRPYFEFNQTRDGLLTVTSKLFGLDYKKVEGATVWHPDVDVYDVFDKATSEKLGRIYLDLHPRPNKFKHAAQFTLVKGVEGKQLPEGALVCNFADPKTSDGPALMDHDQVVVMFHEFGHLVHHVLAGHGRYVAFSGGSREFDFIEAPSQMLEEWAFDPQVLKMFAFKLGTKEPISDELIKKMRDARNFDKGLDVRTQMFYASMSLQYHQAVDPAKLDLLGKLKELQHKYSVIPFADGTHMFASFGHLSGYEAFYYTYMWSLVIAKDLFSEFQKHGLFDEKTARRYRDKVLAAGGTKPAAELVKEFLGRPFGFESYQKWLNE